MNNSPQRAAKGFTRAFWVSNTVELFERMAYYAVFIVLTIYQYPIGFSAQIITVPATATRQAYKFYFHVLSSLLKCKMPSTFTAK